MFLIADSRQAGVSLAVKSEDGSGGEELGEKEKDDFAVVVVQYRAIRPILAGEEVLDNYLDLMANNKNKN